MDIIILVLLLVVALLILKGVKRGVIIGLWLLALVLTLALFRYHVTSTLDLSF